MTFLLTLFVFHFIGDFIFQSQWMASNKSYNQNALFSHAGIYGSTLFLGIMIFICFNKGFEPIDIYRISNFCVFNFWLHLVTDLISSKISTYYWKQHLIRKFFLTIGADQMIHAICLISSSQLFFGIFLK